MTPLASLFGLAVSSQGAIYAGSPTHDWLYFGNLTADGGADIPPDAGVPLPYYNLNVTLLPPAEQQVFVAVNDSVNTLQIVNVQSQTVTPLNLGYQGLNLTFDSSGTTLWETTNIGIVLRLAPPNWNAPLAITVTSGIINHLALDEPHNRLYVSDTGGLIGVIDTDGGTSLGNWPTFGKPQQIVLSPDGSTLYIADELDGLEVWSTATQARLPVSIDAGTAGTSGFGLALTRDGKQLWMGNYFAGTLVIVDAQTYAVLNVLTGLNHPRRIVFDATGATAVVTDENLGGGRVLVIR